MADKKKVEEPKKASKDKVDAQGSYVGDPKNHEHEEA